jgi:presequence protease
MPCVRRLTGDESTLSAFETALRPFLRGFPDAKQSLSAWSWSPFDLKPTAFVIPSQVNYVAKLGYGYPEFQAPGAADVISSFLRMSYLWERVRVQVAAFCGVVTVVGVAWSRIVGFC